MDVNKFKARRVKKLYKCTECKQIVPYNVRGVCDGAACNGILEEYNYKEDLKDNHYYKLYTELEMTPMVVKEHTAQLSSKKAYDYQKKFKDKKINVLSCSTTFEMGVHRELVVRVEARMLQHMQLHFVLIIHTI